MDRSDSTLKIEPISYNWEPVIRGTVRHQTVFIGVRKNAISFSAAFGKLAEFDRKKITHVQMFIDSGNRSISFKFLNETDADKLAHYMGPQTNNIFTLGSDGGGRKQKVGKPERLSRSIQAHKLFKTYPWLASLAPKPKKIESEEADVYDSERLSEPRHCIPHHDKIEDIWIIHIVAGFQHRRAAHYLDIQAGTLGIYRYVSASGETLYIGQGDLKSRFAHHEREKEIPAKFFDYSEVPSQEHRETAETYWIRAFSAEHQRRPRYNKNDGSGDKWAKLRGLL